MMDVLVSSILRQADPLNLLAVESAVLRARGGDLTGFIPMPIYFLSNYTISGIDPFLQYHGLSSGLDVRSGYGDYNVIHQSLMREDSALHQFKPSIVVLSLMYDVFNQAGGVDVCARLQDLFTLAAEKVTGTVVLNTFVSPRFGNASATAEGYRAAEVARANDFIRHFVKEHSPKFYLCDWDHYVQAFGYGDAIDRRYWFMAKAPFKPPFLSSYAADIAKLARANMGLSKKCLMLDCDGTLWGGVLGEDGMEGIKLHPNDYPGNVFYAVQRSLIELHKRGVLLVINSKNNEADVYDAFDRHPHCLLKKEHFSAVRINWGNKAENAKDIAAELNLGLDSFVFLDDSDFECDFIKERLPAIDVRQVPKRPYEYPDFVAEIADELFFTTSQTKEDAARSQLYDARHRAEVAKTEFDDIETYLKSLEIVVDMHAMRKEEIARVSQLTHKTNQFNLAKTPYSEAAISDFFNKPNCFVYVMVVKDRFGELGLTNVCIVTPTDAVQAVMIDSFLMSCRVFERNLEYAFLSYVIEDVQRQCDCREIRAKYIRSSKNSVAENFYEKMGFRVVHEDHQSKLYTLEVSDFTHVNFDYIQRV